MSHFTEYQSYVGGLPGSREAYRTFYRSNAATSFALRFLTDQVPFDVTVSNQGLEEQQHTQEQPNSYRALEP
jgi:hypothetical protein